MDIRKFVTTGEEILAERGRPTGRTVRRAVCAAVITNPLAGGEPVDDLTELVDLGAEIAGRLATRALAALGVAPEEVTAYGKGAIVGTDGEIEHAAALIHPRFGAPVRAAIGGGAAIIPSTKTVGGPGTHLTIPLTNTDDIWSFDEMDAAEIRMTDAPLPHEIVVGVGLATGGRPFARTVAPS